MKERAFVSSLVQDRPGGLWYQELPRRALLLRLSKMAARAVIALALAGGAEALQNGLGLTPPMGYSSWNDCASEITEARVKNITRAMISTGLAAKGFVHINVDEGWLKGAPRTARSSRTASNSRAA